MNRYFYPKLAATNLKKNAQTYLPYILTCIGTVMMYYIMVFLAKNEGLEQMAGGSALKSILSLGSYVIAFFSVLFLFYTHSFVIKRRKKEFGLFNILGMEKRHIAKVLVFETLYVAAISLGAGLAGGILLSKLIFMVLLKILHFEVSLDSAASGPALAASLILFGIIFLLTLLNTLRQIHLAQPVELLKGGQTGEREPKTKWPLVVAGSLCLGGGYYISLTTKYPLAALTHFFIAVLLVIIGTYCLFTAGSIAVLKLLRRNRRYYYQTRHFTTVSGMMYRMKQNAAGLANICIMSTAVLVMISTTVSLYMGMENILSTRYPRNIMITSSLTDSQTPDGMRETVRKVLAGQHLESDHIQDYRYLRMTGARQGDTLITDAAKIPSDYSREIMKKLYFIPLEDYNRNVGQRDSLDENEILLYSSRGQYDQDTLTVLNRTFTVKQKVNAFLENGADAASNAGCYFIVVKDMNVLKALFEAWQAGKGAPSFSYTHYLGFDLDVADQTILSTQRELSAALQTDYPDNQVESVAEGKTQFFSLYGGLFFLGIFLGLLFIMATMLIIYYKQVSEGYDDRERFKIMQKVGMSRAEVKQSIRSQVLTVFFLPLVTAGIHVAFAFPIITKLLEVFNLTDTGLFAWCTAGTVLVFALFYTLVYGLTARVYYRIVS